MLVDGVAVGGEIERVSVVSLFSGITYPVAAFGTFVGVRLGIVVSSDRQENALAGARIAYLISIYPFG